jgi:hypothetical protein
MLLENKCKKEKEVIEKQFHEVGITMKKAMCVGWVESTTTKPLTPKRNDLYTNKRLIYLPNDSNYGLDVELLLDFTNNELPRTLKGK